MKSPEMVTEEKTNYQEANADNNLTSENNCSGALQPLVDVKFKTSKDTESSETKCDVPPQDLKDTHSISDIITEYLETSIFKAASHLPPTSTMELNDRVSITEGYSIGIDKIPFQRETLTAKKGVRFTLMVAGPSGVGKTTFINTLFGTSLLPNIWNKKVECKTNLPVTQTVTRHFAEIEGYGTKLHLTVIDTPGFGDKLNNAFSWTPLTNFIDDQIRSYIFQEEQPERSQLNDKRVHCCLYFLEPTNKGLSTLDVVSMKELSKRVNLIPVIGKADSLTNSSLLEFKAEIRQILEVQNIKICNFLESGKESYNEIFNNIPFSIVASENHVLNVEGKLVLGREYRWGVVEVENPKHSDFTKLKEILINKYMASLVHSTESYYEECRSSLLNTRVLKARDICFSTKPPPMIVPEEMRELFKGLDYENCDKNGLKNYACYQLFNKRYIDGLVSEWCQEYIHRQWESKRRFNEIVSLEEQKFQEWRKAILKKQERFNNEINMLHQQIEDLQLECHDLESRSINMKSFTEKSINNSLVNTFLNKV